MPERKFALVTRQTINDLKRDSEMDPAFFAVRQRMLRIEQGALLGYIIGKSGEIAAGDIARKQEVLRFGIALVEMVSRAEQGAEDALQLETLEVALEALPTQLPDEATA